MTTRKKPTNKAELEKEKKENEWLKPAIIIAILAFLSSATYNFIQYKQTAHANQRADREQGRADQLEKLKMNWVNQMIVDLGATNERITTLSEQLRLDSLQAMQTNGPDQQTGLDNYDDDRNNLSRLEQKRDKLRGEINEYLAIGKAP